MTIYLYPPIKEVGHIRSARVTGSTIAPLMNNGVSSWDKLLDRIAKPSEFFGPTGNEPPPLAWGHKYEHAALGECWERHPEYEVITPVWSCWGSFLSATPDALLASQDTAVAGAEVKCPFSPDGHDKYMAGDWVKHQPQMQSGMLCTGLKRWLFISYDPRREDPYWETWVERDDKYIDTMKERVLWAEERFHSGQRFTRGTIASLLEEMI